MIELQVTESPRGYFTMQGQLNRDTVAKSDALATLKFNKQNVTSDDVYTLDMSRVDHSDTAGLAWLMNFLKDNQLQNVRFNLKNIPET